jgi:hypothetical protein
MSTISALASASTLTRSDSSRSFTHVEHSDATSNTPDRAPEGSSSQGQPVSHFLNLTPNSVETPRIDDASDEESIALMSAYKPQPSESPEKHRSNMKPRTTLPSRTQQKLELQRREAMRSGPTTPSSSSIGLSVGSQLSLHNRSGSRGRNRSLAEEIKAQKVDYETGIKQLTVVRRFRNPIMESLHRMKASGALPAELGAVSGNAKRPQSRRNLTATSINTTATNGKDAATTPEDKKLAPPTTNGGSSRPHSRTGGRVHFQRQGSHDDIGISTSAESPTNEDEGMSREEAIMRRLWDSREVYDSGERRERG